MCLLTTAAASSDAMATSLASKLPAKGTYLIASSTGDNQPAAHSTTMHTSEAAMSHSSCGRQRYAACLVPDYKPYASEAIAHYYALARKHKDCLHAWLLCEAAGWQGSWRQV
jgi:hypothetical protein